MSSLSPGLNKTHSFTPSGRHRTSTRIWKIARRSSGVTESSTVAHEWLHRVADDVDLRLVGHRGRRAAHGAVSPQIRRFAGHGTTNRPGDGLPKLPKPASRH